MHACAAQVNQSYVHAQAQLPADKVFIPIEYEGSNSIAHLGTVLTERGVSGSTTEEVGRRWAVGGGKVVRNAATRRGAMFCWPCQSVRAASTS